MTNAQNRWRYAVIGALAGVANGLFGSGGGLFLVPLFISWIRMDEKKACATSVAVIFPLSVVAFTVFALRGGVEFSLAWPYVIGGTVGGLLSGTLFKRVSAKWLHRLFGALLLYGGVKAVFLL